MRSMTGAALLALALTATAQAPKADDVPLVSYPGLGKLIRSLHGKVVVVYFWADY